MPNSGDGGYLERESTSPEVDIPNSILRYRRKGLISEYLRFGNAEIYEGFLSIYLTTKACKSILEL